MPQKNVQCPKGQWVKASSTMIESARMQNIGAHTVIASITLTDTPPASDDGPVYMYARDIVAANVTLEDLFPGETLYYLWLKCPRGQGEVSVAYA